MVSNISGSLSPHCLAWRLQMSGALRDHIFAKFKNSNSHQETTYVYDLLPTLLLCHAVSICICMITIIIHKEEDKLPAIIRAIFLHLFTVYLLHILFAMRFAFVTWLLVVFAEAQIVAKSKTEIPNFAIERPPRHFHVMPMNLTGARALLKVNK